MKILKPLSVLFLASVAPAAADDELCKIDATFAKQIMTIRQNGAVDVNTVIDKMGTLTGLKTMIIAAYELPRMQTKPAQAEMVTEFVNTWSVKCYKNGSIALQQ